MKKRKFSIHLMNQKEQADFCSICERFDCKIDIEKGTRVVDAKSLLGIASLDTKKDCFAVIHSEDISEVNQIREALERFQT